MKKVILTETQMKNIVKSIVNEGQFRDSTVNSIYQNVNNNFSQFKKKFEKQIKKSNALVDMENLIDETQLYLQRELPNIVKNNKDHNYFLNQYFQFLYETFNKKTGNIGWAKKKMLKAVLGKKEKSIGVIDSWQFKNIIWALLFFGELPNDVDSTWSSNYQNLVDSRKQNLYEKIRNLLLNKIYS